MSLSSHHQRVLLMPGCPEPVLSGLQQPGRCLLRWTEPELTAWTGYGEALVAELRLRLVTDRIDLVVMPGPSDCGEPARSWSLACIEAARRQGNVDVACVAASCTEEAGIAGQHVLFFSAGRLFEVMLNAVLAPSLPGCSPLVTSTPDPKAPRVSVVVRSMDRASLAATLASVSLQTYRPIEIVVVNALGRAHGPVPVERVVDLEVVEVAEPSGRGLLRAAAANAGLDAASAELLMFLDDDDLLLPDHLARLVAVLAVHPEALAAYADVEFGRTVGDAWQVGHLFAADFDSIRLLFENYLPIHSVLFRRKVLLQSCRVDESFDLFEDWDFWLQVAQTGPFVRVPGVSARYVLTEAPGHSEVFEDSQAARTARERLFVKWHERLRPAQYSQILSRLQALSREAAQTQAELEDLRRGHAEQAAVLQAREVELAGARIESESQQLLRETREQELANALAAIEAQVELLKHRDSEIAGAAEYATSLRETLTHREREIAHAQDQLADLRATLDASQLTLTERDAEIAHLHTELASLRSELASLRTELASLRTELASLRTELASLRTEKPLQALARTLRSKNKPHASRT